MRQGRHLWCYCGMIVLLSIALIGCSETDRPLEPPVKLEGNIFGTFYQVTMADSLTQGQVNQIEAGIKQELESVDQSMSTYRDDAELMAFNRSPLGEWQPLSDGLIDVLATSLSIAESSDGAFDVTIGDLVNLWSFGPEARPEEVPSDQELRERLAQVGFDAIELDTQALEARRLRDVFVDLSAIAKGHATDRVAAYLDQQGVENYLVNLGGDLITRGVRDLDEQTAWRVGIEVPENGQQRAQHVLPLDSISVATSGDYRHYFEVDGQRYSHTIDPRTGQPITHDLASVSVFHPSNAWADGWATALMVAGNEDGMAMALDQNLNVLMLIRDGNQWRSVASPAFAQHFGDELVEALEIEIASARPDDRETATGN
ncbi:thiamine biosynthesis lipoprotein [Vreelandella subterranea]|uniref:FAD:protein FMN transferase n=1 Tax=Vreelandella subterranea TaxID=416874 RepID=A0A1H9Q018_9GAMM|nr:FAD:protein FMN transferase [Halomonas subterranea]SER53821.1 thiamine biosynthesis lipoprotein [Halomonas subterranea]